MPSLRLENDSDVLPLNGGEESGRGVQVLSGATGLGLPPVAPQFLEGAGDGATYRGQRVLSRDIDLPLDIRGISRDDLKSQVSRVARMLAKPCTLYFTDDRDEEWYTDVVRVGGGTYTYGTDTTGNKDVQLVITLRAGDPYFTSASVNTQDIMVSSSVHGLIAGGSLVNLDLAASQAIGSITFNNPGDASAYPIWEIHGPGNNFKAVSPDGDVLWWTGTLAAGEKVIIDTRSGTVVDGSGANRYAQLAPTPKFWTVPPGTTTCPATLQGAVAGQSLIRASWRSRKWLVI